MLKGNKQKVINLFKKEDTYSANINWESISIGV